MPKKKVPYVHSNFERVPGDYYPTIDPRCVDGLLEIFPELPGRGETGASFDVCAPEGSGIVDRLAERGYRAQGLADAFANVVFPFPAWIVCNPPYKRVLVDKIIWKQIERLEKGGVRGVAMLLRSEFDFAKGRAGMFDHELYAGEIKLRFRPWWSTNHIQSPIHNFCWHIWKMDVDYPRKWYAGREVG